MFGKSAELRFVNRLYMYQFSILCIGITTLLLPLANNYAGLVSYALVFGFFDGCFVGQIAVITADLVVHEKMSQAIGNMFGTLAIPMSLGPPFAGQSSFIEYFVSSSCQVFHSSCLKVPCGLLHFPTGGLLLIMACTGRHRPKGVPFCFSLQVTPPSSI